MRIRASIGPLVGPLRSFSPLLILILVAPLFLMGKCSEDGNDGSKGPDLSEISAKDHELLHLLREGEKESSEEPIILSVPNDSLLKFRLKVNSCQGPFEPLGNGKVRIGQLICTEACCDPEFAKAFVRQLPGTYSLSLEKETLILEKEGWKAIFKEKEKERGKRE